MPIDFQWITGGKQGSGIDTAQYIFSSAIAKYGYYVFGYREYFSNIKGMHSFFTVRVSDQQKYALKAKNIIGAFIDRESVFGEKNERGELVQEGHIKDIESNGVIIVDKDLVKAEEINKIRQDIKVIELDFARILENVANRLNLKLSALEITKNVIAVASSLYILGVDLDYCLQAISYRFSNEEIKRLNEEVAKETYAQMSSFSPILKLPKGNAKDQILLEGFQAFAIGKAIGGCKLQVYYPITPASDESVFIESHPELGIRVVQPESELAVIGMVIGANLAGVRAATSTSGPGLALMTEGIAWAGMTETPIVVVDHQRGAPATGLPTRTQQGDLKFAINLGHGDFDRIVIAPSYVGDAINITAEAFNFAEMFQVPVIILSEKAISQALSTLPIDYVEEFKKNYKINRGKLVEAPGPGYKRFQFTDDHISPRIRVGNPYSITWVAGDEHDEYGHIDEEPNNRTRMEIKRNSKSELILDTIPQSYQYQLYGQGDTLFISFGTSAQAAKLALKEGESLLQLILLYPFPRIKEIIDKAKYVVTIEQNITGQLKKYLNQNGIRVDAEILKSNGRLIQEDELREAMDRVKNGEKKVILNGY